MASSVIGGLGASILGKVFKSVTGGGKKSSDTDTNTVSTTVSEVPTADENLARIAAEKRLRKETADNGRAGSILTTGKLG